MGPSTHWPPSLKYSKHARFSLSRCSATHIKTQIKTKKLNIFSPAPGVSDVYVCVCVCVCLSVCVCMHMYKYICMCVHASVHPCVCVYPGSNSAEWSTQQAVTRTGHLSITSAPLQSFMQKRYVNSLTLMKGLKEFKMKIYDEEQQQKNKKCKPI